MLQINKGESKQWVLTLTEKTTIANPYYLFSFTNRVTNSITNVILTDVSSYKERYNAFNVEEGDTFTLDACEHQYIVYAQSSSTNTNPSLATEIVESGILKVNEIFAGVTEYEPILIEKIYE